MKLAKNILVLLFLCNFQFANSQSADQIINKYIKAIGGQQSLDEIQTLKYSRKFVHTDSGKINRTTVYYQKPHHQRWESGDQKRIRVTVEKIQWRGNRKTTAENFTWDKGRKVGRKPFILQPWGNFLNKKRNVTLKYAGNVTIGPKEAHRVYMVSENGFRTELFFDARSGLLIQTQSGTKESRFGLMISKISDYRAVNNVMFPFREEATRETADGRKFHQINTVIKVEINTPFDQTIFQVKNK